MSRTDLARAWLEHLGAPPAELPELLARWSQRRAARASPARIAASLVELGAEWLGPAVLLRRLSRGSRLSPAERAELMHGLHAHRWPLVRGAWLLALTPLLEALLPDAPPAVPPHPLAAAVASNEPVSDAYDVLVIGTGAGGAPVAWALAASGLSVLVVDRGDLVHPRTAPEALGAHYLHQGMVASVTKGLAIVLAARAVGGTTPLNSGTCLRPLPAFLEAWGAATLPLRAELPRWLERAEHELGVHVPGPELMSRSGLLFADGLASLGREGVHRLPRNATGCTGAGRCCFGCPTGAKRSTDRSFLPAAVENGARLLARATVEEVYVDGEGASARIHHAGGVHDVLARHVVIAAGALETPALLARSRVGHAASRAGTGLKIHPTGKVFAWFPGKDVAGGGIPQGFGYRPPELPRVALEGIHTPASVAAPLLALAGRRMPWWLERRRELATFGLMVCERGTGRVGSLLGYTHLDYGLGRADAADLVRGLKLVGEAYFAAGAERVLLPLAGVPCEFDSAAELARLDAEAVTPSALPAIGFHPQGTAAIGRVVDPDLHLIDCPQVSVCDASVLPDSPGVNPQLTVMALALRHGSALARRLGVRSALA